MELSIKNESSLAPGYYEEKREIWREYIYTNVCKRQKQREKHFVKNVSENSLKKVELKAAKFEASNQQLSARLHPQRAV